MTLSVTIYFPVHCGHTGSPDWGDVPQGRLWVESRPRRLQTCGPVWSCGPVPFAVTAVGQMFPNRGTRQVTTNTWSSHTAVHITRVAYCFRRLGVLCQHSGAESRNLYSLCYCARFMVTRPRVHEAPGPWSTRTRAVVVPANQITSLTLLMGSGRLIISFGSQTHTDTETVYLTVYFGSWSRGPGSTRPRVHGPRGPGQWRFQLTR